MPEKVSFTRKRLVRDGPVEAIPPAPYVELGVTTPFSFLRGASDAIELVLTALELGMDSIGVADGNTLAGVVRMHSACQGAGLRPLIGCRLEVWRPWSAKRAKGLMDARKVRARWVAPQAIAAKRARLRRGHLPVSR